MVKITKKISILLTFVILFSSCKKIIDSIGSSGIDKVAIEDLKEIDVNEAYKISVPDYMTEMKDLNEDASFQYANTLRETYFIVIDEDKAEFINAFKEVEIYKDSLSPLQNYVDYQVNAITEGLENGEFKKIEKRLRLKNSQQFEITGKIEGLNIAYLIGFVEGKENMYMMMSWTLQNRFKKYNNTFHLIQNSLKIKE